MFFLSFQSTHSRGVRRECLYQLTQLAGFNPRTHEECDLCLTKDKRYVKVSIHALTRSATLLTLMSFIRSCFNPRTHEECDCSVISYQAVCGSFNPRTHEECDAHAGYMSGYADVSIHALTRSATHIFFLFYFQIFRTRFSRIFLKNIKSKR